MSRMKEIRLDEISRPRRWSTLPRRELKPDGFPVYGANGIIGYTDRFNHEEPTLIIGCRGSCGTLHITEPKSYVTGNAVALDSLDTSRIDQKYLFHYLADRGFADVVSGTPQPQITGRGLSRVRVPLLPLTQQQRVAGILDKADDVRRKRELVLGSVDDFIRSKFIARFGTPQTNPRSLPTAPINAFGKVVTGNTPPRKAPENYGDEVEWIKSGNINAPSHFLTPAQEYLSVLGKRLGRIAPPGSTLVTCIAGSPGVIGNAALADREVAFNQQINAVIPNDQTDPFFLYCQFLVAKALIQANSTNSMKGMVSKERFQEIEFLRPNLAEQIKFGEVFRRVITMTRRLEDALEASEQLFRSIAQRAFRGEL